MKRSLALLAALALLAGCSEAPTLAVVGEKVSAFELASLAGGTVASESLSGDLPVVLNFWATWCRPCLFEIPVLQELHRAGAAKVVSIALDEEGAEVIGPFAREHGIDYPILLGDIGLLQDFGSSSIPFTLVLDGRLQVRRIHRSLVSVRTLEQDLAAAR